MKSVKMIALSATLCCLGAPWASAQADNPPQDRPRDEAEVRPRPDREDRPGFDSRERGDRERGERERGERDRGPEGRRGRDGRERDRAADLVRRLPLMIALDKDSDGQLSADEVTGAVAALNALDKNGDGVLDRHELRPHRPAAPGERLEHLFQTRDADHDGRLVGDEIPTRLERMLGRFDTNGDGIVERKEMESAARHRNPDGQIEGRGPRDQRREGREGRPADPRDH